MRVLSIGEVADSKIRDDKKYFSEPFYNQIEVGRGKNKKSIPLYAVVRSGQKVLFFKDSIDELKDLHRDSNYEELSKRLFKAYQFESDSGRIKFRHHLAAGIDTELKKENKEYSSFELEENPIFMRLTQAHWNFAIDGVDFEMKVDGKLTWIDK